MKIVSRFFRGLTREERVTFKYQLIAIFIVITLLDIGFNWQRSIRDAAARRNVQVVMRGWDGFVWYVWVPVAPATLILIRRFPFRRDRAVRSVLALGAGSAAIYFVVTNTRFLLRMMPNLWLPDAQDHPISLPIYLNTQLERMPLDFLTYCGLFAASYAIDYYRQFRQRVDEVARLQLQAARLQSELAHSQLAALRGQLHPHFLFNSFNAISTLVRRRKNEEAVDTIARLSELLRFVMETIDQQVLSLERELELARCYLDVEGVRFGPKLVVVFEVEPDALDGVVPSLLLQPLVENAIKHGIAKRVTPGTVRIKGARYEGRLVIEIANDGPDVPVKTVPGKPAGIGLPTTRRRLEHVFGADYRFELRPEDGGGVLVRLDLPWRTTAAVPLTTNGVLA